MRNKIILFSIVLMVLCQCNSDKEQNLINNSTEYMNYLQPKRICLCENGSVNKRNLEIYLKNECYDIKLDSYLIAVQIDGEVYRGQYTYPITIHDFCFCNEGLYTNSSTLSIWAMDTMSRKLFIWENKESYDFREINSIQIKILSNGLLKLKFNNQWFYHN